MQSALVLNATYEPLSVVPVRRAVCLVLSEKAEILHDDGTVMRSARRCVARPLVIRLRYMVKVPYHRRTALSRRAVFARDNHRCQYCGEHADSIDHVLPRSRGGLHVWENVVAACRPCNLRKRDRTPDDAGMNLVRHPVTPRELAWVVVAVGHVPEVWRPYLATACPRAGPGPSRSTRARRRPSTLDRWSSRRRGRCGGSRSSSRRSCSAPRSARTSPMPARSPRPVWSSSVAGAVGERSCSSRERWCGSTSCSPPATTSGTTTSAALRTGSETRGPGPLLPAGWMVPRCTEVGSSRPRGRASSASPGWDRAR